MRSFLRLRQFSLRTGLILFVLLTIAFGVAAHLYHDVLKRGEVQRLIGEHGDVQANRYSQKPFSYTHAPEKNAGEWTFIIRKWVHSEYGRKYQYLGVQGDPETIDPRLDLSLIFGAEELVLSKVTQPKSVLMSLGVKGLKHLEIVGSKLDESTPFDWRGVSRATDLEELSIDGAPVSRGLAEGLSTLPKLQRLKVAAISADAFPGLCRIKSLTEFQMPWAPRGGIVSSPAMMMQERQLFKQGFGELARREQLTQLSLRGRFPLEPADLREFCGQSKITTLKLQWTDLNPECLREFARLPNLVEIEIQESRVADEHLMQLAESKSLKKIRVAIGAKNSGSAMLELRKKMPECEITRF